MNLDNKKKIIISVALIIILIIVFVVYLVVENRDYSELNLENEALEQNTVHTENTEAINEKVIKEEKIAVHITGEVKKEGIIYLNEGARIVDAIKAAGGETEEADLSQVNLAYELQDGQKIYIPNKKEKVSQYITENSGNNVIIEENNISSNQKGGNEKVNINTANQSELERLPGIGPSLAERIINYREENGNFKNIDELKNVKGIGDAKYTDIKDRVTIWIHSVSRTIGKTIVINLLQVSRKNKK